MHRSLTAVHVAFLIIFIFLLTSCSLEHPKDKVLVYRFQESRGEYNALLRNFLAAEDIRLITRAGYQTRFSEPVATSQEAIAKMQTQLQDLGLKSVGKSQTAAGYVVSFTSSSRSPLLSTAPTSSDKGYIYLPEPPHSFAVEGSLNNLNPANTLAGFSVYRQIECHWYLYFRVND